MSNKLEPIDILEIIARSPWFKNLPFEAHQALAEGAEIRHVDNNTFLWGAGEKTTEMYCVLSGMVRLNIVSAQGQEFTILDIENEFWFNEVGLLSDLGRVNEAIIKGPTCLLVLPRATAYPVGERFPLMYKNLFTEYMSRTRRFYELLGGMLFYSLKVRLAGRILELLKQHGEVVEDGTYLNVNLSQNDFARLCLGSRQRVNKVFREWNNQKVMVMRNDRYFIPDMAALEKEIDISEL